MFYPNPKMLHAMPYAHSQANPLNIQKYHVYLYHIYIEIPVFASHRTSAAGTIQKSSPEPAVIIHPRLLNHRPAGQPLRAVFVGSRWRNRPLLGRGRGR